MNSISGLNHPIYTESEKNQLQLVSQLLTEGETGLNILMDWMISQKTQSDNLALGKAYQALYLNKSSLTQEFLTTNFPDGVVSLNSERNINYQPLQQLLAQQDFQGADVVTLQKLCELAGTAAVERKWIYFTEVEHFPSTDLQTLDTLWLMSSEGKFGFSVQRRIWLSVGKDFAQLWAKIGWKSDNIWTRYP
ncbi:MAG: GUN4 N-terminal ARM-like repeat domain-containing protein, partial [Waterburya sp.]